MNAIKFWILIASLVIFGNISASAQQQTETSGKLSFDIRRVMNQHEKEQHFHNTSMRRAKATTNEICAFVKFKTDDAEELLGLYECEKVTQIGDIYVLNIPIEQLAAMAADDHVERIETQTDGVMLNDLTPQWVNNTSIYAGANLPQAYDGTGVLLGIVDGGFDVTHPAFYSEDGKTYRIKGFVDEFYDKDETRGTLTPLGREYTSEEDILDNLHVGDSERNHATHALGTAAGSGYGSPYRGVAYGADIFAISSRVASDEYIANSADQAARMKRIFDYADQTGQPCVISYSIGFDNRPGDALLFQEAMQSMLGPGKILVAAAGNSGMEYTYVHKPSGMETTGSALTVSPSGSFYMISEQPFLLKCFSIKPFTDPINGTREFVLTDSITFDTKALPADSVEMRGHHILMEKAGTFYTLSDRRENKGLGDIAALAFIIEGKDADVQAYSSCIDGFIYFTSPLIADTRFEEAESSHNIGMPATLPEVVSVGALNGRDKYVNAAGNIIEPTISNSEVGLIAKFSSTGPTISGLTKPDVVAPGTNIVSAGNSYSKRSFGENLVTKTSFNGREYPWITMSGTSMAAPCVAGIVALWLQADPTLTADRVKELISQTSRKPDDTMEYPNNIYGHGLIDAYAGMLKLLGIATAIPDISTHQPSALRIQPTAQGVRLAFGTAPLQSFSISVYSLDGQLLSAQHIQPDGSLNYDITLPEPPHGICAVQLRSNEQGVTGSELIRY